MLHISFLIHKLYELQKKDPTALEDLVDNCRVVFVFKVQDQTLYSLNSGFNILIILYGFFDFSVVICLMPERRINYIL